MANKTQKKVPEVILPSSKRAATKNKAKDGAANSGNTVTQNRLKLLITIVNKNKAEFYLDLLQSFEVNMQFVTVAHGTANEEMLGFLGLTDTSKVVIFSVIQEKNLSDALRALEEKFRTIKNGKGIAYTIPFTSVIGTLLYGFLANNRLAVKEKKE